MNEHYVKTQLKMEDTNGLRTAKNQEGLSKLASVNSVLNITNRILDGITFFTDYYSKLNVIPFKMKDGNFYLYDKRKKKCGRTPYWNFTRNKEYLIVRNSNGKNLLLKNGEFLFEISEYGSKTFSIYDKPTGPPSFFVMDNEYIVIYYYVSLGGKYITGYRIEMECVYNLKGNVVQIEMSNEKLAELVRTENAESIHISKTLWRIEDLTLRYKNRLIEFDSNNLYLRVSDFHCGYAEVREVYNDDPEYGSFSNLAGLIDIEGNFYWHASQATLF